MNTNSIPSPPAQHFGRGLGGHRRRGRLGVPAGEEAPRPQAGQAGADEPGRLLRRDAGHPGAHARQPPGAAGEAGRQSPGTAGRPGAAGARASTRSKRALPAWTSARGDEIRSPKSEGPKEGRNPRLERSTGLARRRLACAKATDAFGLRPSAFGFPSGKLGRSSDLRSRQFTFGARSFVGPRRFAAGGPRAPFHNNTTIER